ncbi:non-hydrolyzing UDP-N-acetylglucosamine 2-epimerase [Curtobacterium sp. MCBA15_012]|uniref:non-hydrolyzing UDP-N-acetylglucosamine 2-epimerase n=1 Tax=Curtobacterium sp. MCBA15_012 TaxID=1898738 RepID=UPI0008DD718E|nr:UDP-N-acetylglucosamine 2-epimerase (non-hydrolyzing) [Curtobacterium sp. MCBA15_012]WIB00660.1 UDP-N-acetylglucosamine 2-epimerase (non-hydrolyzing) [Curtobacterium sp. MCBA15_012]
MTTNTTRPRTKVLTVVGTRPELIRLSEVIHLLERTCDHVLVHTGQNHDRQLNDVFFEDLGLRQPDHLLSIDTSSLGSVLGDVLRQTEQVLLAERPDAVLVLGDTNSALAAIIAKRMRIPVFHMEAGNRSFDENVPEETNRRLVDHVADYNLVYTEHARRNLLSEGIHPARVVLTGSPLCEVLAAHSASIAASDALEQYSLEPDGYVLVSAHREENVDDPERLIALLDAVQAVGDEHDLPVLVSTHPRTRRSLTGIDASRWPRVILHEPFGFHDYIALQRSAFVVLSDSGTISEESVMLGFPAVTLRERIERPEAIDTGSVVTAGVATRSVTEAVRFARATATTRQSAPAEYAVPDTARRVVGFILGTAHAHHANLGIRRRP